MISRYVIGRSDFDTSVSKLGDAASHWWRSFHDRLAKCCFNVWKAVRPALCVDSPEGQGDTPDDDDEDLDIGIKDTLSYSWRTLKESRYVTSHLAS